VALDSKDVARLAVSAATRVGSGAVLVKGAVAFGIVLLLGIVILGPIMAIGATSGNTDAPVAEEPDTAGGAGPIQVDGNTRQLAEQIMAASSEGRVTWLDARHREEVEAYTLDVLWDGDSFKGGCFLDSRILQVIVLALGQFDRVGISSLNRSCTGETPGAGRFSLHWQGKAVDFYSFNGVATNGRDSSAQTMLALLDRVSNDQGGIGQVQCGSTPPLANTYTFRDGCNHLHYQLGRGDDPLKL